MSDRLPVALESAESIAAGWRKRRSCWKEWGSTSVTSPNTRRSYLWGDGGRGRDRTSASRL